MGEVVFSAEAVLAALLLLALAFVVVTLARRRLIARDAELALCTLMAPGESRARTGMMRMTGDALEWYRLFGLTPRPRHRWSRRLLEVGAPERVEGDAPAYGMMTSSVRVPVFVRGISGAVVIVMAVGSYTAFRAWAEAAPSSFPVDG